MTSNRAFKTALYEQLARVSRAMASAPRLELLDLLAQGPKTVDRLAEASGQSRANASQHLQVLRRARLVERSKEGLHVTYRLAGAEVAASQRALRQLAEARLTEIDRLMRDYLSDRGQLEEVSGEEVAERLQRGDVVLLDVRPRDEFDHDHLPGAVSIPLSELSARMAELPDDREIVAYCRGPYCVMAVEAVALLRAEGRKAARLADGVQDWSARGHQQAQVGATP